MKTILKYIPVFLLVIPFFAQGQSGTIDAALQQGNASGLSSSFAKSVDLLILHDESTVTPAAATAMLADFFAKSGVRGYKQNHISAAQNGRPPYTIGDLTTAQGTYRVSIFYDTSKKISEIRIEN